MTYSLADLPSDVLRVVASFMLPTDLVSLGSTCKSLLCVYMDRGVWLQIAENVSHSWPISYTAAQARDARITDLARSLLRTQSIATYWARPEIYSNKEVKIAFPDNRIINYFTFLPGSRHVLVYDMLNVISCWTVDGAPLNSYPVDEGVKLTRWKPLEEPELVGLGGEGSGAVEITLEYADLHSAFTRSEIILLLYSNQRASFSSVASFCIPDVYQPFSAWTQDETHGSLVGIRSGLSSCVGIYVSDKNSGKAICIDTGLPLTFNCIPQALLSRSHLVLYTETLRTVDLVTYDLQLLRSVLTELGFAQDDTELKWPVKVPPSDTRTISFETVSSSCKHARSRPCHHCAMETALHPDGELMNNRDPYPIIIPKWTALREDLRRHRIRSIMTLSKRPQIPPGGMGNPSQETLAATENGDGSDGIDPQQDDNDNLEEGAHGIHGHLAEEPHVHLELEPYPHAALHFPDVFPRELATITHHYFDYSSLGDEQLPIKRTVLTQTFLRRPRVLVLPWPPRLTQDPEWVGEGDISDHLDEDVYDTIYDSDEVASSVGDTDALFDSSRAGDSLTNVNAVIQQGSSSNDEPDGGNGQEPHSYEVTQEDDALHLSLNGDSDAPAEFPVQEDSYEAEGLEYEEVYDGTEHSGLQLSLDGTGPVESADQEDVSEIPTHGGNPLNNLMAQPLVDMTMARTLAGIGSDPFGGCPVMGYGGRSAIWVEERSGHDRRYETRPVLRLATFPAYKRPMGKYNESDRDVTIYPELERGSGHVATLHVSDHISLENAYSFDLDDISGRVGITTSLGELWIVQCAYDE